MPGRPPIPPLFPYTPPFRSALLEPPAFLHVGSLTARKNVLRLADAFALLGRGSLTFVGDGPLRPQLEGPSRGRPVGREIGRAHVWTPVTSQNPMPSSACEKK